MNVIIKVGETDLVQRGILISKYIDNECDEIEKIQAELLIETDEWCNTVYVQQLIAQARLDEYFA